MKALPALALGFLFPAVALAETGNHGCKAPIEAAAAEDHSHCGVGAQAAEPRAVYTGTGSIARIDKAAGNITIAHDPVAALHWPAMTMRFGVPDKALFKGIGLGKKVSFQFEQRGSQYVITALN